VATRLISSATGPPPDGGAAPTPRRRRGTRACKQNLFFSVWGWKLD
jgi:hypothetical protein